MSSKPFSAYSLARSSSDLKVPSSLAVVLHGMLMAPGDVATLLRLLLRKVGGSEDLAGELVRATNVDEVLAADGVDDLVAECADREVGGSRPCTAWLRG